MATILMKTAYGGMDTAPVFQGHWIAMYGLITPLTAASGRREELALTLLDPAANRRGCHHYVVALGADGPDSLWVTEIWVSEEAHRAWVADIKASEVLRPALALIATWGDTVITRPMAGIGI